MAATGDGEGFSGKFRSDSGCPDAAAIVGDGVGEMPRRQQQHARRAFRNRGVQHAGSVGAANAAPGCLCLVHAIVAHAEAGDNPARGQGVVQGTGIFHHADDDVTGLFAADGRRQFRFPVGDPDALKIFERFEKGGCLVVFRGGYKNFFHKIQCHS